MRRFLVPVVAAAVIGVLVVAGYRFGARLDAPDTMDDAIVMAVAETACRPFPDGCEAGGAGLELRLRFLAQPSAMKPTVVQLESSQPLASATVDFQMVGMDMGLNRYRLAPDERSSYRATVMLPVCVSGRRDWIARVHVVSDGRDYLAEFPFEAHR